MSEEDVGFSEARPVQNTSSTSSGSTTASNCDNRTLAHLHAQVSQSQIDRAEEQKNAATTKLQRTEAILAQLKKAHVILCI